MTVNELSYVVLSDWLATTLASVSAVKSISAVYIYIQKGTLSGPHFSTFLEMQCFCMFLLHHVQSFMFTYL